MVHSESVGITFSSAQVFPKEGSEFLCDSRLLMQTDESLARLIESGETVFITGRDGDNAVLCTADATYSIRRAETSNLMMTISQHAQTIDGYQASNAFQASTSELSPVLGNSVIHTTYTFLETVKMKPNFEQLIHTLKVWSGPESLERENTCTTAELLDCFQASEEEIRQYMVSINAIELLGRWWLLDLQYVKLVLNLVLLTDIELDLQNKINFPFMKEQLTEHEIPDQVLRHCLMVHSKSGKSNQHYELCMKKVSRTIGHAILAEIVSSVKFSRKDFKPHIF